MYDDAELLRRYAARRDEAAFATLVERHVGLVYGAAVRQLGGAMHRAEDVTQSVFIDLAQKAPMLAGRSDLSGWLYTSTHYAAAKLKRSEQRRQAREQEAQLMQQIDSGSDEAAWEQVRPVLDDALLTLPERDREALLLRFFHGRRLAEMGRLLAVSEDAARMRVDRALERLRTALSRRGVTSTAAALGLTLSTHASTAAPTGLAASLASAAVMGGATASSVGPLLAWAQLMSTSKIAVGGAALAAALAVGLALREIRAERAAAAAVAIAQRDQAALHTRLREQEQRIAAAEHTMADLRRAKQVAAEAEAARKKAAADQRLRDAEAFMARHPAVKRAIIELYRARADSQYAGLFRELSLSAEQIERFKDLVAQGRTGTQAGSNSPFVPFHTGGDRADAIRELQTMLGPEGFSRYKFYESASFAVERANQFAGLLAGTATPLTAAQAQRVQSLLLEHRMKIEGSAAMRFEWAAIFHEARTLLTPPQIALLESYRDEDAFTGAMYDAVRKEGPASYSRTGYGP